MEDLGIPDNQIGSPDHNPHERDGGGNSTGGRLNVNSGVLDLEFHAEVIGLNERTHYGEAVPASANSR